MQRSASRSKWKDVLGFDDGTSPDTPHTFRYTPSLPQLFHTSSTQYPLFPRSITFTYHKNLQDILIRQYLPAPRFGDLDEIKRSPKPKTLFYIKIYNEPTPDVLTSRPEIILHAGRSQSTRVAAFAKFHSVTASTDITLCPNVTGMKSRPGTSPEDSSFSKPGLVLGKDDSTRPRFKTAKVETKGGMFRGERFCFSCWIDDPESRVASMEKEVFEWKILREKRKKGLEEMKGFKLIRAKNRELVAIFEREESDGYGAVNLGNLHFLAEESVYGGELDVLAVVSLLSILEKESRGTWSRDTGFFKERCGFGGLLD